MQRISDTEGQRERVQHNQFIWTSERWSDQSTHLRNMHDSPDRLALLIRHDRTTESLLSSLRLRSSVSASSYVLRQLAAMSVERIKRGSRRLCSPSQRKLWSLSTNRRGQVIIRFYAALRLLEAAWAFTQHHSRVSTGAQRRLQRIPPYAYL